jgi:chorismate mutase
MRGKMMKKIMISIVSLLVLPSAWACSEHDVPMHSKNQKIEKCEDLKCVRSHIDELNKEIISLLVNKEILSLFNQRTEYVKQAGQIKIKNGNKSATDVIRVNEVLENVEKIGQEKGLPPGFTKDIFQVILDRSAYFEQKDMDLNLNK